MTTAPNAKCQRVLCTRCMPGLDSGYNSRSFHVCIFWLCRRSRVILHTAQRLASSFALLCIHASREVFGSADWAFWFWQSRCDAAHNSSWQLLIVLGYWKSLAVSPFSLVLACENLSRQTVCDKIVCAWQDCLSVTKTSDVDANDATRFSICLEACHSRLSTAMYRATI